MKNGKADPRPSPRPDDLGMVENLTELLGDDEECVASLAMEQLLNDDLWRQVVKRNLDSDDSVFRRRLHQMNNIGERRRQRDLFVSLLRAEKLQLWDGLMMLDHIYDNQSAEAYLEELAEGLVRKFKRKGRASFEALARFMVDEKFTCVTKNWLDIGNYILGDVLESHCGSVIILCAIMRHVGAACGIRLGIYMRAGCFLVCHDHRIVTSPSQDWELKREAELDPASCHACQDHELLRIFLQQLFVMSVAQWNTWDVNFHSSLLEDVHRFGRDQMPYPLGKARPRGGR